MRKEIEKAVTEKTGSDWGFIKSVIPVAAALVVFLVSAGFIIYKIYNAKIYYERWKDYADCGI
jgi:hypothetical protein